MSQLRYQLRKIMPRLSEEANKLRNPEARSRWMKLRKITFSPKSLSQACGFYGMSEDAYTKWGTRLLKQPRMASLFSKSRKPFRSPRRTKPRKEKKVIQLRRADPSQGPERISDDLSRSFNMSVPPSTVYGILRRQKLISQKQARKLTKKHLKRYRRPWPGYLQMDFKYVPYKINGHQYYQLSCVDHHSSWRFVRIYQDKSLSMVITFLEELKVECPFIIIEIQTDNDTAFTDRFSSRVGVTGLHEMDQWCMKHDIVHRLIPVGQKELNGKVENTHKQDDREFFAKGPYRDYKHIEICSRGYNQRWNTTRRTKALGFKSPMETIEYACVRVLCFFMTLRSLGPARLDQNGNAFIPIPKTKKIPTKRIKTRKPSAVEKYLSYLEWEAKNKAKAFILAPTMSQNFSMPQFFKFRESFCLRSPRPKEDS